MDTICPVCNQLQSIAVYCTNCGDNMIDQGRVSDYFDDYSPYEEIENMKMVDGYPNDRKQGQCPHLFICHSCQHDRVVFIDEWRVGAK